MRIEPVPLEQIAPDARSVLERAHAEGRLANIEFMQILAYSPPLLRAAVDRIRARLGDEDAGALDERLRELVRLRSAQLGGCAKCAAARFEDSVTDEVVECLALGVGDPLTERELLAIRYVELMHLDHDSIDDEFYRRLADVFSVREIVELGWWIAWLLGPHRLVHTLDILGDAPPAIAFDPAAVHTSTQPAR
jgi:alkylhydroperoxidase family enzyme